MVIESEMIEMAEYKYPALFHDRAKLVNNMKKLSSKCGEQGIEIAGIIKATNGTVAAAEDFVAGGAKLIGSSRLDQLKRAKESGIKVPLLLIRIPMLSEISEMVDVVDISLNSEMVVLEAINKVALEKGTKHKVILMADLGDLREGFFDLDELVETAVKIENEMLGLVLAGIGTNLGCYGSVIPTEDKMVALAELADRVEAKIGRRLEYVSGGATTSLLGVYHGYMPEKINMLRLGAGPLIGPLEDVRLCYNLEAMGELDTPFVLKAEVIELKVKASYPQGELGVDAAGKKREYVDKGMRKRALLAIGRADYGDIDDLVPEMKGTSVIGASGDHTIIDVEDASEDVKIGDIMTFKLKYSALLNLAESEDVKKYEI